MRVLRFSVAFVVLVIAPWVGAAEMEPDANGPWVNVDVIDLVDFGDASYLEYLGQGYVAMLDTLKSEGVIIDFGVMMKTTGETGDGDVVVWWSVQSLADYEKAGERMQTLAGEIHTPEEWQAIWSSVQKLRTVRSSNLYRAVLWSPAEK